MKLYLAATYHDPDGRLYEQMARMLPVLTAVFSGIAIQASPIANQRTLQLLSDHGATIEQTTAEHDKGAATLGRSRRNVVALALQQGADFVMLCDGDRAIHWAEFYPDELAEVARFMTDYDFTVIGRTPRAFASHPHIQKDTEAIVNRIFAQMSGLKWDITSATRGLSRRAAELIVAESQDDSLGVDGSWPLLLQQRGGFQLGYVETEGMEFETADRFQEEVTAVGGYQNWLNQLDADPQNWLHRLDFARIEIEAMMQAVAV
jgi:hypothetical protein